MKTLTKRGNRDAYARMRPTETGNSDEQMHERSEALTSNNRLYAAKHIGTHVVFKVLGTIETST